MALGTADLKPTRGDLVKVITDKYPSVPKGTIAVVDYYYKPGSKYALEGFEDVLIDPADLEIVSYKRRGR